MSADGVFSGWDGFWCERGGEKVLGFRQPKGLGPTQAPKLCWVCDRWNLLVSTCETDGCVVCCGHVPIWGFYMHAAVRLSTIWTAWHDCGGNGGDRTRARAVHTIPDFVGLAAAAAATAVFME